MKRSVKTFVLISLIPAWLVMGATSVLAANEAMLDLLKELKDNGTITQEQYEALKNSALADEEKATAEQREVIKDQVQEQVVEKEVQEPVKEQVKDVTKDYPEITAKGKFEVKSKDGKWKWRLGGRLQLDGAYYNNDNSDLTSGAEVRRARLYVTGTLWRLWDFKFQYDFTDSGAAGIRDAYVQYTGFDRTWLRVGNFKQPFSLEEMTSSRFITFQERSLANALEAGRFLGIGARTYGKKWTAEAGFFGNDVEGDDPGSYAVVARGTFAPIHEKTRVAHLGASLEYRDTGDDKTLRYRQRPESHVTDVRLIDTGTFDADAFTNIAIEAAGVYGPFYVQGEYINSWVNRQLPTSPNVDFGGWFVQGSWFLTGESKNYQFKKAVFGNIKPRRHVGQGWGAWEVAFRYSTLDLTDKDIDGGTEENITLGLNWYLNPNMRLTANLIKVLDVDGGPNDGAKPGIAQMRAQIIW